MLILGHRILLNLKTSPEIGPQMSFKAGDLGFPAFGPF